MKVNLNTIYRKFEIDQSFIIPDSFLENSSINKINDLYAKGFIDFDLNDELYLYLHVTGNLVLSDAVTLDDINYKIDFEINENLEEYLKNKQNILDIIEVLWENIVLEVPISVTNNADLQLSGDGWNLNGVKN